MLNWSCVGLIRKHRCLGLWEPIVHVSNPINPSEDISCVGMNIRTNVCECLCVRVCVCACVRACVCACARECACASACMCVRMCACVYVRVCACVCV